ncbi:MAG: NADH-quinone oxidoreductase subunit M, partial [Pseudomonadota bacterium]
VIFGQLIKQSLQSIEDMNPRERAIIAPLVVLTVVFGVYPSIATDFFGASVAQLVDDVIAAQEAAVGVLDLAER